MKSIMAIGVSVLKCSGRYDVYRHDLVSEILQMVKVYYLCKCIHIYEWKILIQFVHARPKCVAVAAKTKVLMTP